jgi:hypothetical protein
MKIFLSWSGDLSHAYAAIFQNWLKLMLQTSKPWRSDNLDRGALFFQKILAELNSAETGIIFLTRENSKEPWILFEAGSLVTRVTDVRLCTFLIDLEIKDVTGPFANFNHTTNDKESVYKLVQTLNKLLKEPLSETTLEQTFEKFWPDLIGKLQAAVSASGAATASTAVKPTTDPMLEAIFASTQAIEKKLVSLQRENSSIGYSYSNRLPFARAALGLDEDGRVPATRTLEHALLGGQSIPVTGLLGDPNFARPQITGASAIPSQPTTLFL